jgi:type IV pilus assembly protein PilO
MTHPSKHYRQNAAGAIVTRHCVGLALLLILLSGLLVQLGIDWHIAQSGQASAQDIAKLDALWTTTLPLRGANDRITRTSEAIETFYTQRIPESYSEVSSEIIGIGSESSVQLSHVKYDQKPAGHALTEISIESEVTGTYPQIMRFVNGLERSHICFVVRAMNLTGQQRGEVNLQLRFSTWLRPADATMREIASATRPSLNAAKESE